MSTSTPRISIRRSNSDNKKWHVEREGYALPLAAFYEHEAAVRYADKTVRIWRHKYPSKSH